MDTCMNCEQECDKYVCDVCYRDPETNNCEECGKHLHGIVYPYICGDCVQKEQKKEKVSKCKLL